MSKKFLFGFVIALAFLAAAVLWLLSAVPTGNPVLPNFNPQWAILIVAGVCALAFILRAFFDKSMLVPVKKLYVILGAGFIVVCVFMLISIFAWDTDNGRIIAPIIGVVIALALVLMILATGGKKWDQADNKNVGYKNYHQRKAEEEAARKKEESGK